MNKDKILNIIKKNVSVEASQGFMFTKKQVFDNVVYLMENPYTIVKEKYGFVMLYVPENPYLYKVHLFSDCKLYEVVKAAREITIEIFNETNAIKLYGITSSKSIVHGSSRSGWKLEGTLTKSYICADGSLKDQYIMAACRDHYVNTKVLPLY